MNKRIGTLFGFVFFILVGIAGYSAISDLVSTQSQQHQQSVSPIFGLIESELVEPLHMATTLDKIGVYKDYFMQDKPNQKALVAQLKKYSESLGLTVYVAHDKSRKQYNSNGRVFDLIEGEVIWYFALKNETDYPVQAVLGNRDDVHLYIDVRQYDDNGNFIGFVGVGKPLGDFITSFKEFKKDYGHEFIFVNNRDEIVLSSKPDLLPTSASAFDEIIGIKNIASQSWYAKFVEQTQGQVEPSLVVPSANGDMLVSKLRIKSLDWSIYLLTPLSERQEQANKSFALYIGLGLIVLFLIYKIVYAMVDSYADKLSRKRNYDPLTNLSNRRYAELFFSNRRKLYVPTAVLMIGLDNFKKVRETHGYLAGDLILQKLSDKLSSLVEETDLLVRWNGDKFVVLLMSSEQDEALDFAQKCRELIEQLQINVTNPLIETTASIGVACSRNQNDSLSLMAEWAQQSMQQAKREGKNRVVLKDAS